MFKSVHARLLIMILSIMTSLYSANAAASTNLYTGVVNVADQSEETRNKAMSAALEQVLLNVGGNTDILKTPHVVAALKQAPQWVVSYSYHNKEGLQLAAHFDANQVNNLLKTNLFAPQQKTTENIPEKHQIAFSVYGINDAKTLSKVNQYLQQVGGIQEVTVESLASDHVVFNLILANSEAALENALADKDFLVKVSNNNSILTYQVNS